MIANVLLLVLLSCAASPSGAAPSDDVTSETDVSNGETDTSQTTDTDGVEDTDEAISTWRSALYPEAWTPEFSLEDGHFLHDFSYAGYHAGEVALKAAPGPTFDVTAFGADSTGTTDSTAAIEAAIAAASASAPAVVDFPAGTFRVDGKMTVTTSGVVLRGEGSGATFVYFSKTDGMDYSAHVTFAGAITQGADHLLATDGVSRATTVQVSDTDGVSIGDSVAIGWTITDDFVADHGMTGVWTEFNGQWKPFFRRTVTGVDAATGTVTIDVPLRYPALVRDSASLRVENGALTECGIEGMSLSNVNASDVAWEVSQVDVLRLSKVKDCWVRDVASWESPLSTDGGGFHLLSGGIQVADSRRVTVADSVMQNAQNRGSGGNGYLFQVARSNEVLIRDSVGRNGRHNFIQNWDFGTSGCVWLRTTSEGGSSYSEDWHVWYPSYSEFHHSLAMANLIDESVATDGWQGVNRQEESSGAGHTATQSLWWNISGGGYLRSLQFGDGYIVGTDGMDVHVDPDEWDWNNSGAGTSPTDWTEGLEEAATLDPPSLNALNKLNNTTNALSGVFERISSGLRINKAADDAAGLGVAEGLDSEIRAFKQGIRNANDGISII